jgi:hypothetical protein
MPYGARGVHCRCIASVVRTQLRAQKAHAELFETMAQIKRLEGLLPICAACKRIRNEGGNREIMEKYITAHSEARFSHSVCPECARKHPQYADEPAGARRLSEEPGTEVVRIEGLE